jgi:hypothetical protein
LVVETTWTVVAVQGGATNVRLVPLAEIEVGNTVAPQMNTVVAVVNPAAFRIESTVPAGPLVGETYGVPPPGVPVPLNVNVPAERPRAWQAEAEAPAAAATATLTVPEPAGVTNVIRVPSTEIDVGYTVEAKPVTRQ